MSSRLENISIIRHFKDTDDLLQNGTNSPLESGQKEIALDLGRQLRLDAQQEGFLGVALIISPKIRVIESAHRIQQGIEEGGQCFKTAVLINPNLRELDQGELILPPDYKRGTRFEPLTKAWKIFWNETFNVNHNLLYRFGSCDSRGELRYPELQQYFRTPGECYRDQAIRLYSLIYEFAENLNRFCKIKPIVITHGAPLAIFRELEAISNLVKAGEVSIPEGGLVQFTWDNFIKRPEEVMHPDFGQIVQLPTNSLRDPNMLMILKREIDYLRQL